MKRPAMRPGYRFRAIDCRRCRNYFEYFQFRACVKSNKERINLVLDGHKFTPLHRTACAQSTGGTQFAGANSTKRTNCEII